MGTHESYGCLWLFLSLSFILCLGYLYLEVNIRDSYSGNWVSNSSAEAKEKDVFLREYEVSPRVVKYENYRVEFTDCWVEERTEIEHDFIFFKKVIKLDEPRFVLNYRGQRLAPDPDSAASARLVSSREDYFMLAESKSDRYPNRLVYRQFSTLVLPDSVNNDTLYFSIVRRFEDERAFFIKAYPKKQ